MADLTGLTTNYFATPKEGFTTTTASTVASGAVTVPLNSVTGYTNGAIATFVIEPTSATAKQAFTGVIDTAGVQVTSVVWTEGTNQTHNAGSTVVDYTTATHFAALVKGTLIHTDQDGTLKAGAVDGTTIIADGIITKAKFATTEKTEIDSGWQTKYGTTTFPAPNTVTALGNRSYTCVFNSVDLTSTISNGMRLKLQRTVAAPTQSTSLNGTTQYYSKTSPAGMTFTNNFVVSAWVKLSSYAAGGIASRYNGTGWIFNVNASGQVVLNGYATVGTNISSVTSYQSIPLNKWVHVAAQLDMSTFTATTTTSYIMIDGVDVPASVSRGGTNPTSLIQGGNLEIGSYNAGGFFPGKIAQVAIYNAKVTQATIQGSISQTLSGSETSLISAYSFNNSINDLNANANNLTANGSAVATNADSPFAQGATAGSLEYGIVTGISFSTNTTLTVQVPEGSALPTSGGVSAVSYSTQENPYGCPSKSKFQISVPNLTLEDSLTLAGIPVVCQNIIVSNTNADGGSARYSNTAGLRTLVGATANKSVGATTTTLFTFSVSSALFNTTPTPGSSAAYNMSAVAEYYGNFATVATTVVSGYVSNRTASPGTSAWCFTMTGN